MSLQVSVLIPKVFYTKNWVPVQKTDFFTDSLGLSGSNFGYGLLVLIHILFSYCLYQIWNKKEDLV